MNSMAPLQPRPNERLKKVEIMHHIMLHETLPENFEQKYWGKISRQNPKIYLRTQQMILQKLLSNKDFFSKYFATFYSNHAKIYRWFLLSREKHHEIESYVFKKLLQRKEQNYRERIQEEKLKPMSRKKCKGAANKQNNENWCQGSKDERKDTKATIYEYSQQIFDFLSKKAPSCSLPTKQKPGKTITQKDTNSLNLGHSSQMKQHNPTQSLHKARGLNSNSMPTQRPPTQGKSLEKEGAQENHKPISTILQQRRAKRSIDFHDMFVKTFDACDGLRYIFYNYQKHMKGLSEKEKYNEFIRGNKPQNPANPLKPAHNKTMIADSPVYQQNRNRLTLYEYHQDGWSTPKSKSNSIAAKAPFFLARLKAKKSRKFRRK